MIPVCGGVSYGSPERGYRQLCNRCLNEETARSECRIDTAARSEYVTYLLSQGKNDAEAPS